MSSTLTRRLRGGRYKFATYGKWTPAVGDLLDRVLEQLETVARGFPTPHQETHLVGGTDQLQPPSGVPPTLSPNASPTIGEGPSFMLEDARAALDLLLTLKGDSLTRDGSQYVREPVGADGTVLTADPAQPTGRRWAPAGSGGGAGSSAQELADMQLRSAFESLALRDVLSRTYR